MRIWLLNPYGPIPDEGWRPYRFTLIGRALARRGHDVTWWTASFAHHFKRQRCVGWNDSDIEPGFRLRLVPTPSYAANVGLARIWFEAVFSARVYRRSRRDPPPDLVLSIEPPQFVSYLADAGGALRRVVDLGGAQRTMQLTGVSPWRRSPRPRQCTDRELAADRL
jgi:hypothetical protein